MESQAAGCRGLFVTELILLSPRHTHVLPATARVGHSLEEGEGDSLLSPSHVYGTSLRCQLPGSFRVGAGRVPTHKLRHQGLWAAGWVSLAGGLPGLHRRGRLSAALANTIPVFSPAVNGRLCPRLVHLNNSVNICPGASLSVQSLSSNRRDPSLIKHKMVINISFW